MEIITATTEGLDLKINQVLDFFRKHDSDFSPLISEREGGIEKFVKTVLDKNGTILVDQFPIQTTVSYFPYKEGFYFHWYVTSKNLEKRGTEIFSMFCQAGTQILEKYPNAKVYGDTWPENKLSAKIMEAFGLKRIKTEFEKELGRITYFYEGTIQDAFQSKIYQSWLRRTSKL